LGLYLPKSSQEDNTPLSFYTKYLITLAWRHPLKGTGQERKLPRSKKRSFLQGDMPSPGRIWFLDTELSWLNK
jgi:hypothetical protein